MSLVFGIYPGGAVGDDTGGMTSGRPDDPDQVSALLDRLQVPGRPFLVRAYAVFTDAGEAPSIALPLDADRYARRGRTLDLVAQYRSPAGDVAGYRRFVADLVARYGAITSTLQVGEEPNVTDNPLLDGHYPGVGDAVVTGVRAAAERARELGLSHLRVGVNTTPLVGPSATFLADLVARGGPAFVADCDYVGLDFFPDVFRPVADVGRAVAALLRHQRDTLRAAGLGDVPLHVTECGWPTAPPRTPQRQAELLTIVVDTLAANAASWNVAGYTHFTLRDADTSRDEKFHRFGLTTDAYAPKPAFSTYQRLIAEHTAV